MNEGKGERKIKKETCQHTCYKSFRINKFLKTKPDQLGVYALELKIFFDFQFSQETLVIPSKSVKPSVCSHSVLYIFNDLRTWHRCILHITVRRIGYISCHSSYWEASSRDGVDLGSGHWKFTNWILKGEWVVAY